MGAQTRIRAPPVESNLLGFVDRADQETNLNREKFDVGKVDLDIADDDKTLVEHSVEDVNEAVSARRGYQVCQAVVSVRLAGRLS